MPKRNDKSLGEYNVLDFENTFISHLSKTVIEFIFVYRRREILFGTAEQG